MCQRFYTVSSLCIGKTYYKSIVYYSFMSLSFDTQPSSKCDVLFRVFQNLNSFHLNLSLSFSKIGLTLEVSIILIGLLATLPVEAGTHLFSNFLLSTFFLHDFFQQSPGIDTRIAVVLLVWHLGTLGQFSLGGNKFCCRSLSTLSLRVASISFLCACWHLLALMFILVF